MPTPRAIRTPRARASTTPTRAGSSIRSGKARRPTPCGTSRSIRSWSG
jgi:hypothetical protein